MTTTDTASQPAADLTALDMARNLVSRVEALARAAEDDPLGATVHRLGDQQHACAERAAHLALVSLAEDVHRIADALFDGRLHG